MKAKAIVTCVVLAAFAPGAKAEPWRAWPSWTFVEAGSVELRARIDATWGGLGALLDPPRYGNATTAWPYYGWDDHARLLAKIAAAAGPVIDRERPVRELARPVDGGLEIAFLFVVTSRGRTPDQCAYVERADALALVCGSEVPAAALRDDFLTRGTPSLDARALHGEVARDRGEPVRAIVDATEDDAGLHLHERAIVREPGPVGTLSAAALSAAARLVPLTGEVTAMVIDDDGTSMVHGRHLFLDRPLARVFDDELAQLRDRARGSTPDDIVRFAIDAAPAGLPRGARVVRTREASSEDEWVCSSPCTGKEHDCAMDACTFRRMPGRSIVETSTMAFVPDGTGTWEIEPVDDARAFFSASAPAPVSLTPAWSAAAREVGVWRIHSSNARIWWARTRGDGAEMTVDVEGRH